MPTKLVTFTGVMSYEDSAGEPKLRTDIHPDAKEIPHPSHPIAGLTPPITWPKPPTMPNPPDDGHVVGVLYSSPTHGLVFVPAREEPKPEPK